MLPRVAPRSVALFALVAIAASDQIADLTALVAAQGRLLEQMQQQLQSFSTQTATMEVALQLAARQGGGQGAEQDEFSSARPGHRQLDAPATQRKTWHHSILHSFDVPTSCGLHAELDSDATGPMDITRSSDGNVTMGYGGATSATQPGVFELNHPANCKTATLTINHPVTTTGDLAVGGALTGFPLQTAVGTPMCSPSCFASGTSLTHPAIPAANADTVPAGWVDWITQPLVLTKTSLVLMSYQVAVETFADKFCVCRMFKNAGALTGTVSITGGEKKMYGTISGQWIGTMPAGTHSIKLNCRNNGVTELGAYFETQDLSVTVLG